MFLKSLESMDYGRIPAFEVLPDLKHNSSFYDFNAEFMKKNLRTLRSIDIQKTQISHFVLKYDFKPI